MFKKVSGTKDILPEEISLWQKLESSSRRIFGLYNYQEIRPPLIEDAALFNRSLGASSEIVQKQMFLIQNKEESYCLRPEGTASIVRAYIENNLDKTTGFAKFFYLGPMFRLERPQKGRLRQFHHIGCEAIGSYDAALDIEIISLADTLLKDFSVSGYKIKINTLGCLKDKQGLTDLLRKKLESQASGLCPECNIRLKQNVLRVLDCKNDQCRQIVERIGLVEGSHLCGECKNHFNEVKNGLDALGINYEVSNQLVRGLDYYTRTVFEITHQSLGAQDAIGAGGRYNNLVQELGGPDLGAVGFALGVERVLLALENHAPLEEKKLIFLITMGEEAKLKGTQLLDLLRKNSLSCDRDYESKSIKGAMRRANDLGAGTVLILGEDELKSNTVTFKDMKSGLQKQIPSDQLVKELKC